MLAEAPVLRDHRTLVATLIVATLAFNLVATMVAPAMPNIQEELGASTTGVAWVLTAYLLAAAVCTPLVARLGDILGHERVLLATLAIFAVGLLVSAFGQSLSVLVAGRVVQGTVGGAILPLAYALMRERLPADRLSVGVSVLTASMGVGGSAGLVMAGVIVDALSYRWLFLFGLAMTGVAAVLVTRLPPGVEQRIAARVDWLGAGLLAVALSALLIAIGRVDAWGWTGTRTLALIALSAVVLVLWALHERVAEQPLVDVRLLRRRGVWVADVSSLLNGCCQFGAFLLVPQFVQAPHVFGGYGFDASVAVAGLTMVPCSLAMLLGGACAAAVHRNIGPRLALCAGFALAGAGFGALLPFHGALWQINAAVAVTGLGLGLVMATMGTLLLQSVPRSQAGEATSITVIARTVGGALGSQVAAAILASHLVLGSSTPSERGYEAGFALCMGVALLGVAITTFAPGRAIRR
jgi:EmrB/QacA subfamily drug resistance transporter